MQSTSTLGVVLVAAGGLVVASCGASDVEGSSEYVELRDERDELVAELDDVRAELDEVDDQLAVAESQRDEAAQQAESTAESNDAVTADLNEFLVLDVMNRVGLSPDDAQCVADAFIADPSVRQAYLVLIDPAQTDPTVTETAYGEVTTIMEDCGLEIVQDEPATSAEMLAALDEALGEVEIQGTALPPFVEGAPDAAVGTAAPVVVGTDYDGGPVTIDPAADGPTMVIVMAHWCPHCNAEIPKINQLRDEGRIPDGVNVVAVSSGVNPERANFPPAQWIVDTDWTFPVVADGTDEAGSFLASAAYGTAGVPFVILIDGEGDVTQRWAGERDVDELAAALDGLAAG